MPIVTIAKIRGRARGAGSELALACDMRFAARENAILGQIEVGAGTLPGAGGVQHLARLLGRGRAMEAILGADDFDAEVAERYGWINRALPDADLDTFVARLAAPSRSRPSGSSSSAATLADRRSLMIPSQDPDYGDLGPAFPPWPGSGRDAILQPPKPEITPSPQVLQRAADREAAWEGAD